MGPTNREISSSPFSKLENLGEMIPQHLKHKTDHFLKLCNLILCGASVFQVITGKLCSLVPTFILDFFHHNLHLDPRSFLDPGSRTGSKNLILDLDNKIS